MKNTLQNQTPNPKRGDWLDVVREQVSSLRFGVVQITVHDSHVVQVEKTERVRFETPKSNSINSQ